MALLFSIIHIKMIKKIYRIQLLICLHEVRNYPPSAALMAMQVAACDFSFDTLPNMQRGLVSIGLTLGAPGGNAGQITLVQQAQVNNSP